MWVLLFSCFTRNYRLIDQLQQRHSREYLTVLYIQQQQQQEYP